MPVFTVLMLLLALLLCGALAVAIARGTGWIGVGRRLTEVAMVLMVLVAVVGVVSVARGWDEPIRVDAVLLDAAIPPVASALPDGVDLPGDTGTRVDEDGTQLIATDARVPVTAVIPAPGTAHQLLAPLPAALAITAIGAGLLLLRRLLLRAMEGDPFTQSGARDLRLLGAVILAGSLLVQMVDFVVSSALVSASPVDESVTAEANFSFAWILGAVLVLALAEIWAAGVRMRDDLAGVV